MLQVKNADSETFESYYHFDTQYFPSNVVSNLANIVGSLSSLHPIRPEGENKGYLKLYHIEYSI